jgi:cyclic lactone autoinducer peptide
MRKKVLDLITRTGGIALSFLAILVGIASVNSACMLWYHQPKVPQGMEKFKRNK